MISTVDMREAMDALAFELQVDQKIVKEKTPAELWDAGWRPKLNPVQKRATLAKAIFKLYYGERASGKSQGACHEFVRFLFLTQNGYGFVVVKELGMALEGGIWDKLGRDVLHEWAEGLGIEVKRSKLDPQTKKAYIWFKNYFGGWSQIVLVSMPIASQVEYKMRGREPDIILGDEAQTWENDDYFVNLSMQLGRRQKTAQRGKLILTCNPEGPSHWLYERFFIKPFDEKTGVWDARYFSIHIPISDNLANLPPGYYEDFVIPALKNDPIAEARLIRGEWVDRPEGNALFAGVFSEKIHVVGNRVKNMGISPIPNSPAIVSYDLGGANSSVAFIQVVATSEKTFTIYFDELDFVGVYTPYPRIVPKIIERMRYWEAKIGMPLNWVHVSDNSAFNQYRAISGSYDVWDVEKISKAHVARHVTLPCPKCGGGKPRTDTKCERCFGTGTVPDERFYIKMQECPKPPNSIEARTRMLSEAFSQDAVIISAMCPRLIEMCKRLPHEPGNAMEPKKRHRYVHNFDSATYGPFYMRVSAFTPVFRTDRIEPMFYGR